MSNNFWFSADVDTGDVVAKTEIQTDGTVNRYEYTQPDNIKEGHGDTVYNSYRDFENDNPNREVSRDKDADESMVNEINFEFQLRKKYIAENMGNFETEEIILEKILECDPKKTSGAVINEDKLIVTIPNYAYAVEGSGKVEKKHYPKDANTFALYISDDSDMPLFIVT